MKHSESINEIAAALVKAQAALKPVAKSGRNPHFKTLYSTFDDIMSAAAAALRANGLALLQHPTPSDGGVLALETRLIHESGQWIAGTLTMPLAKADPQGYGSAMTYARRYGLQAMLGISGVEDDDGESAMTQRQNGRSEEPLPTLSAGQLKALHAAGSAYYGESWGEDRARLVEAVTKGRATSSKDLTPDEASKLIDGINRKAEAAA